MDLILSPIYLLCPCIFKTGRPFPQLQQEQEGGGELGLPDALLGSAGPGLGWINCWGVGGQLSAVFRVKGISDALQERPPPWQEALDVSGDIWAVLFAAGMLGTEWDVPAAPGFVLHAPGGPPGQESGGVPRFACSETQLRGTSSPGNPSGGLLESAVGEGTQRCTSGPLALLPDHTSSLRKGVTSPTRNSRSHDMKHSAGQAIKSPAEK